VLTVLRNRVYLGDVFFRGQYHAGKHEPLIERELFEAARRVLVERGENWSVGRSNPSEYLLAGCVVCGRCANRYVGGAARGRSARYRYYTCLTRLKRGAIHCPADRLPAPALEEGILDALRRTYAQRDLLSKPVATARRKTQAARPAYEEQLVQVDGEIAKTEEGIERYLLAFEAKTLPEAQCGDRVRALSERLQELRHHRAELVVAVEEDPAPVDADLDAVIPEITDLLAADDDVPALKALLRVLIEEVRVEDRDAIYPTFRVPLRTPVRELSGLVLLTALATSSAASALPHGVSWLFQPLLQMPRGSRLTYYDGSGIPHRFRLAASHDVAAVNGRAILPTPLPTALAQFGTCTNQAGTQMRIFDAEPA